MHGPLRALGGRPSTRASSTHHFRIRGLTSRFFSFEALTPPVGSGRFREKTQHFKTFERLSSESHGQNLALTVLYARYSLDSGLPLFGRGCDTPMKVTSHCPTMWTFPIGAKRLWSKPDQTRVAVLPVSCPLFSSCFLV